jgi:hypothetical protein
MKKLIYILILALICINAGHAQSISSVPESKIPGLDGHTFPSLSLFKSSFVSTSLQADLGFGITSLLKIGGIQIGEHEIFSFEGKILFFSMDVQYQQRFNPWLAMYFSFSMVGRVGTDMSMILADGVNTISGGDIGWLIRIKQSKKFNLSGTVKITKLTGNFINVTEYFKEVINDVPDPTVMKKISSMSAGIGIQGAYAFNPLFGMQFHANYAIGESFEREGSTGYYSAGLIGDVDFMPEQNVPIGLALGYILTSAPDIVMSEGGITHLMTGKVGYTGSKEFELGLQYTYYNLKLKSVDQKPSISTFTLLLKFYF